MSRETTQSQSLYEERTHPLSQFDYISAQEFENGDIGFVETFKSIVNDIYPRCFDHFAEKQTNPKILIILDPYSKSDIDISLKHQSQNVQLYRLRVLLKAHKFENDAIYWS